MRGSFAKSLLASSLRLWLTAGSCSSQPSETSVYLGQGPGCYSPARPGGMWMGSEGQLGWEGDICCQDLDVEVRGNPQKYKLG